MYFKIKTVLKDFVEVEVNVANGKSSYVSPNSGEIMYWPEFLMRVNSVEFHDPKAHNIYLRPFDHAGKVYVAYSFMRPLSIKNQWINVALLDDDFQARGKGWIQWRKNGKLLVKYSLLS